MKRQSIAFILLLLQVLLICAGCASADQAAAEAPKTAVTGATAAPAAESQNAAAVMEAAPAEESLLETEGIAASVGEIGIFEGLEDNHTAIFSFDGAEKAFYFEDEAVQEVLYDAVAGSAYTLSYEYDDSFGFVIYEISE